MSEEAENYRLAGERWADLEAAASLLEDLKSATLAQRVAALGDLPVSRAENIVKATPDWKDYIEKTVEARRQANAAKVELEYAKMKHQDRINSDANSRAEAKLM